jgi:hypothetical protein
MVYRAMNRRATLEVSLSLAAFLTTPSPVGVLHIDHGVAAAEVPS